MLSHREKILVYIQKREQATVVDLENAFDIEKQIMFQHLKSLIEEGLIQEIGLAPRIIYVPLQEREGNVSIGDIENISEREREIIEENFLLITPGGNRLEGVMGFSKWSQYQEYSFSQKAKEYADMYEKHEELKHYGFIEGIEKFHQTFGATPSLDAVFYKDFYTWEIFGKTKLGQLLFYAKQSQDKHIIREIIQIVAESSLYKILQEYFVDAVCFIPPTVRRTVQLMDELKKELALPLPEIRIQKITGPIRVPQKTLSKLEDRLLNARTSFFVSERRLFHTVLLIDDALGSGATFFEVAKKLKKQGIAKKVIGLAITGSLKEFDVIREI
ncbi:MAG: hypothetical protein IPN70_04660 [Candidatus Moraniibacteriota bacterium]|nr:MAG: hypothetical protein IPN70_04660 [Candidatus Moranbacteria bacterium]